MLSETDRSALQEALRDDAAVALAYLFGSHAQGRARASSDIDVAVLIKDRDHTIRHVAALTTALEQAVGRPVDVTPVAVRGTSPRLLNQVLQHGHLLYARDEATRVHFETAARSKYLDMKPHIDAYHKRVKDRLLHD
jgi:predicted nucleotidyltransferase